ncbi:hypothetical protein HOY82DRAFT_611744 [Tuber indicum]|nr:hypothetical protein HOY82DRAFT_611744 [Tuber indicum]
MPPPQVSISEYPQDVSLLPGSPLMVSTTGSGVKNCPPPPPPQPFSCDTIHAIVACTRNATPPSIQPTVGLRAGVTLRVESVGVRSVRDIATGPQGAGVRLFLRREGTERLE